MKISPHIQHSFVFIGIIGLVFGGASLYSSFTKKNIQKITIADRISKAETHKAEQKDSPLLTKEQSSSLADSTLAFSVGPRDARVVVVEFIDFQCPFCREAHTTMKQLMEHYRNTSVRFVIRQFPLIPIHPFALATAHASLCARDQEKFLSLHDLFYERQHEINEAAIYSFAGEIGLDLSKFNACIAQKIHQNVIIKDISDGERLDIQGTPTWFVNGEKFEGALSYDAFKEVIDQALQ